MTVNAQDIELLDMYLDHELGEDDARSLDVRLANDPALQQALDRLRSHRSLRLAAMSRSFDSDTASIERLVASVRDAQASESMEKASQALALRRRSSGPIRSIFSAAACVAFGLLLGVAIQRQQAPDGAVTSPAVSSVGSFGVSSDGFEAHGTSVVSVRLANGRVLKFHFPSNEAAQRFVENINKRADATRSLNLGNATILEEEPY
jgi:anti-sigma factor RsiW